MINLAGRFWAESRSEERTYPQRYASDERRGISPKAPGPFLRSFVGFAYEALSGREARSWPISSSLVGHMATAMLPPRSSISTQSQASKLIILLVDNPLAQAVR